MNGKDENHLENGDKEWAKTARISVSLDQTCVIHCYGGNQKMWRCATGMQETIHMGFQHFMAMNHTSYCGLVHGLHVEK
jgi:hypothetical protein